MIDLKQKLKLPINNLKNKLKKKISLWSKGLKLLSPFRTLPRLSPLNNDIQSPFFIVGSGRSGNTLLRACLMRSPSIYIPPETYVLGTIINDFSVTKILPWNQCLQLIFSQFSTHPEYYTIGHSFKSAYSKLLTLPPHERSLARILDVLYRDWAEQDGRAQSSIWGDKTPSNTSHVEELRSVFPRAKFIHMLRDGRDVTLSYVQSGLRKDYKTASWMWQSALESMALFTYNYPGQVLNVRYEELLANPERVLREVTSFIGVEFTPEMLAQGQTQNLGDVNVYQHHQRVLKGWDKTRVSRWKQEPKHIQDELWELNKHYLENWGYPKT